MTAKTKFPYHVQVQSTNSGEWITFYARATLNEARRDEEAVCGSSVRIVNVNNAQLMGLADQIRAETAKTLVEIAAELDKGIDADISWLKYQGKYLREAAAWLEASNRAGLALRDAELVR